MTNKLIFVVLLLVTSLARAQVATITVVLKDYATDSLVMPENFSATIDGADVVAKVEGTEIRLPIPSGARVLALKADAGQAYRRRSIALYTKAVRPEHQNIFFVEKIRDRFDRDYLTDGLARLDNDPDSDAALAVFENAFRDQTRQGADLDPYEAVLRYNYARALQQTCLRLSFDTCGVARKMLDEILQAMNASPQDRKIYQSVRVNVALIQKALNDLSSQDAKIQYESFTAAVAAKDFDTADRSIEGLEKSLTVNPLPLRSQGLTASRIAKDRAFLKSLR